MEHKILDAVETFYDSVGDQYDFASSLEAYSAATADTAIGMSAFNPLTGKIRKLAAHNMPDESFDGWQAGTEKCPVRETLRLAAGTLPLQIPIMRRTIVSDEDWLNSLLYRRVAQPWGFHGDGYSLLSRNLLKAVVCAFVRTPDQQEIGSGVLASMALLNKHLARAISMQQRLSHMEQLLIQSHNIFNLIEFGMVLFGADEELLFVNASAKRIFNDDDGLQLTPAGVQVTDSRIQKNFSSLLAQTYRKNVPLSAKAGGVLRVPRPSGCSSYTVSIAPLNDRIIDLKANGIAAVVFIFDPNKRQISTDLALTDCYGLTKIEAELATSLMHGETLHECAKKRRVSYNTIKTRLHSVFMKTSTNRQAELVSLLLRSVVGLNLKN